MINETEVPLISINKMETLKVTVYSVPVVENYYTSFIHYLLRHKGYIHNS
jgi:hypothetical protein